MKVAFKAKEPERLYTTPLNEIRVKQHIVQLYTCPSGQRVLSLFLTKIGIKQVEKRKIVKPARRTKHFGRREEEQPGRHDQPFLDYYHKGKRRRNP